MIGIIRAGSARPGQSMGCGSPVPIIDVPIFCDSILNRAKIDGRSAMLLLVCLEEGNMLMTRQMADAMGAPAVQVAPVAGRQDIKQLRNEMISLRRQRRKLERDAKARIRQNIFLLVLIFIPAAFTSFIFMANITRTSQFQSRAGIVAVLAELIIVVIYEVRWRRRINKKMFDDLQTLDSKLSEVTQEISARRANEQDAKSEAVTLNSRQG